MEFSNIIYQFGDRYKILEITVIKCFLDDPRIIWEDVFGRKTIKTLEPELDISSGRLHEQNIRESG